MWKSPAFERNKEPISGVLSELILDQSLDILEVASGPGQHICHFGAQFPKCSFQPTERSAELLQSIGSWASQMELNNIQPPTLLDVNVSNWNVAAFDLVVAINFLHMVTKETVSAFLKGSSQTLRSGGHLVVYDCFTYDGLHVSDSNRQFDQHLRATTPGRVYAFELVSQWANQWGLLQPRVIMLPANNQAVVWKRA
jgi:cyclopropane fatty-acyl-phospholipid synthase-like methyltransferase